MKKGIVVVLLPFLLFLVSCAILPSYGMNSDSSQHFTRGQMILTYFLTGKREGIDPTPRNFRDSEYTHQMTWQWMQTMPFGHPTFNDVMMAVSNRIFHGWMGVAGDLESYHFVPLAATFILALTVSLWAYETVGLLAAVVAVLSIYGYPLLFAEQHFNLKDPSEAAFFTLSLYLFWKAVDSKRSLYIWLSAAAGAYALGTKLNYMFFPVIIMPWLCMYCLYSFPHRSFMRFLGNISRLPHRWVVALLAFPLIAFAGFYCTWPVLWENPAVRIGQVLDYYRTIGASSCVYIPLTQKWFSCTDMFPVTYLMTAIPPTVLVLFCIGFVALWKRMGRRSLAPVLWVSFLAVTVLRVTVPISSTYGGRMRHIMEVIAPIALIAGLGADALRATISRPISGRRRQVGTTAASAAIIILFVPVAFTLWHLHPNQNAYFNFLVGGIEGASRMKYRSVTDTYGNAFYQGLQWINANAPDGSCLDHPVSVMQSIPVMKIRKGLKYFPCFSGYAMKGEYLMEQTYPGVDPMRFFAYRYADRLLKPVHTVSVDGVDLVKIWKNDAVHLKPEYSDATTSAIPVSVTYDERGYAMTLDTPKTIRMAKLSTNDPSCQKAISSSFLMLSKDGTEDIRLFEDTSVYATPSATGMEVNYPFAADRVRRITIFPTAGSACNWDAVFPSVISFE